MDWNEAELEKELEAVLAQSKEKRLEFYFRYGCNFYLEDLNLTDEDVRQYQERKEAEISMKPTKKRDILVKQVIKPLFKGKGFQNSGRSWWKELDDCWLFIYMKNSRWNGAATGAAFSFEISVSGKDEIRGKLSEQWIYNQLDDLCQNDFLPYCGFLTPRMNSKEYTIGGYRNYLPYDEPLEEIMEQIKGDFENFIFPALDKIRTKADWEMLYKEKQAVWNTTDILLLRYYSGAHMLASVESNIRCLIYSQQDLGLTAEQILSHFDWLDIIVQNSARPLDDPKSLILKALDEQRG